jgi:hypothetical protein
MHFTGSSKAWRQHPRTAAAMLQLIFLAHYGIPGAARNCTQAYQMLAISGNIPKRKSNMLDIIFISNVVPLL